MRTRPSVLYPLIGVGIAAGAPLGLLMLRRPSADRTPLLTRIRRDLSTYLYVATAVPVAFAVFGLVLGRRAEQLASLSTTDALTGLANLRAFSPRFEHELERSRRWRTPLSLLLLDLDHLKALNDEYGHMAGNRALRAVGESIRRHMRAIDIAARVGGDEFWVLAPGASSGATLALAGRLRSEISAARPAGQPIPAVTTSIGVVTFDPVRHQAGSLQRMVQAADRALYRAKAAGRNCIMAGALETVEE